MISKMSDDKSRLTRLEDRVQILTVAVAVLVVIHLPQFVSFFSKWVP